MRAIEANDLEDINLEPLLGVPVAVSVEVGRTEMTIGQLLEMAEGAVIELGRDIDAPLDVYVNESQVAKGVVVVEAEQFGIKITEVMGGELKAVGTDTGSPEA